MITIFRRFGSGRTFSGREKYVFFPITTTPQEVSSRQRLKSSGMFHGSQLLLPMRSDSSIARMAVIFIYYIISDSSKESTSYHKKPIQITPIKIIIAAINRFIISFSLKNQPPNITAKSAEAALNPLVYGAITCDTIHICET